ncbi:MAG: nucleotidyltransferase [Planctomycetes bacterium B3_Pla]|nr:MAG: nucleotidyltransferase [Planctomycetes bacterium B3_Pla]
MRQDRERLLDIHDAITGIEKYAQRGRQEFEKEELIQTWIIHHLLILGEAASALSDTFKEQHAAIPWSKIVGMRNILVHDYFEIDVDIVWSVVESDLPQLKRFIEEVLRQ